MNALSHAMTSWFIGQAGGEHLRDQRLITWLGLAPDVDCVAYVAGMVADGSVEAGFRWHRAVHHHYTHGVVMIAAAVVMAAVWGRRRARTAWLAGMAVGVHILCDVVGSGSDWPVYPLWPVADWAWTVDWSVPVYAWPNTLLGYLLLGAAVLYARRVRRSPLEAVSVRLEQELFDRLDARKQAKA